MVLNHNKANANIEEVNALWKGLGYYSRASRLLAGAQKVVNELAGYLPDNAKDMEAKIPGIGRYSAGAICSIAYAEKVPVLDGNVHRLMSRLLMLHANPKAKPTLDILWAGAEEMVAVEGSPESPDFQNPGDINQALIELGSTWCGAYQKTLNDQPQEGSPALQDIEDLCTICEPLPATFDVTMLPMKAEKKKAREEVDLVNVVEWRETRGSPERWFLVVKRPEKGLLAGLYEFPTLSNVSESGSKRATTGPTDSLSIFLATLIQGLELSPTKMKTKKEKKCDDASVEDGDDGIRISQVISVGDVLHVFSHVKKTYRTQWVVLEGGGSSPPALLEFKPTPAGDKPPTKGKRKANVAVPSANGKTPAGEDAKWVLMENIDQENTSKMWFSSGDDEYPTAEEAEIDLYAVLNLNRAASQAEINERYRALSLLFHPDKQQNPVRKEAAEEEYLKVQKAYQVLSDPFLRQVYDVLGLRAVSLRWPENFPTQSQEKIDEELRKIKKNGFLDKQVDEELRLKTHSSATVDASALFRRGTGADPASLWTRLTGVRVVLDDFRHTFSRRINNSTFVSVESHSINGAGRGFMEYTGTVRHQFSPRFTGKASVGLKGPFRSDLQGTYKDDFNTVHLKLSGSPLHRTIPPSATISYTRRLFQQGPQVGAVTLHAGRVPRLALEYISPMFISQELVEARQRGIQSISGLRQIFFDKRFGLSFNNILPMLTGEVGVTFFELSTRFKTGVELGLLNSTVMAGLDWTNGDNQVSVKTNVSAGAAITTIEQVFSPEFSSISVTDYQPVFPTFVGVSLLFPSVAAVLSYHFLIRPRRRTQRIAQIRAARRALEEDSDARRKQNATTDLLKDVAHRNTSLEEDKGGLVIQEASYGVTDETDGAENLSVDVIIPLQALVRNSRLYIPGGRSKSNLQGFSDPAPFTSKTLRIRYVFRGRSHYAAIPDYLPVVLPLSEHSVGEC
ncbi:hypothetical protein H1R20_g12012, partial [Candolleomyces eurysporus]